MLLYYVIRRDFQNVTQEHNESEFTPAKYTVEISNLPK